MSFYQTSPLPIFPPGSTTSAGYTERLMPVVGATYSAQRTYQTYIPTVMMIAPNGQWMSDLSDMNPRSDMTKALPFEIYRVYVLNATSPDGDLPFKPGDYFYPNVNMVGLVAGTAHTIRGWMPNALYTELFIERKL